VVNPVFAFLRVLRVFAVKNLGLLLAGSHNFQGGLPFHRSQQIVPVGRLEAADIAEMAMRAGGLRAQLVRQDIDFSIHDFIGEAGQYAAGMVEQAVEFRRRGDVGS
jgi:hypothetical protein